MANDNEDGLNGFAEEDFPEDIEIKETNENLSEEIENSEVEFSPPDEKNDAKQLNVGNVFAVVIIAVVVIMSFIVLVGKPKKKQQAVSELDKAGAKYIPEIKIKEKELPEVSKTSATMEEKNVDEILNNLPPSFQKQPDPQPAPVKPVGSTSYGTAYSDRPDTRNSKSPRKVDGIAGQNYTQQQANNQNIISSVMNGTYRSGYENNGSYAGIPSREEYIQRTLGQSGAASFYSGFGNSNISQAQQYQNNKEAFFNNGAGGNAGSGEFLSYAALWEGTVISGVLETAINTDNPGVVIARVTENIYSSYDASFLLVPEGSLLYATYNSSVSYGQNRVQIAWNILIRPDGYRVQLGNMNGVDAQGASGTKGKVTNHPFETLKALGLVAIFSVIHTEVTGQINSSNNQYVQNALTDVYGEASRMGARILDKALDIKPTITIKPGTEVKFITNTTLELPPVKVNEVTRRYVRTR